MAIGIIIGAAFGKIVSSFVADIMMPRWPGDGQGGLHQLFATLSGGHFVTLAEARRGGGDAQLRDVLNAVIDFIIVALPSSCS